MGDEPVERDPRGEALFERLRDAERAADPAAAIRNLQAAVAGLTDAVAEMRAARYDGGDETGSVTATVDGTGRVGPVRISARAVRGLDHRELGAACLAAVLDARRAMTDCTRRRITALTGQEPPERGPDLDDLWSRNWGQR
jgi:DNA-binding protein YbaB